MSQRVGIVGLSHLGIVASVGLASLGLEVTAVDHAERVAALTAGRLPVHEPGLGELLARSAPTFTADYAALKSCELVIVALDTVTDELNRSDLSVLDACIDRALPWLPGDGVVALMSQVPVGYTRALSARLRSRRPELKARLYYWVETLVIGEALVRYLRPERIIIGGSEAQVGEPAASEPALDTLLARFGCPIFRMSYESAELCKAAINLYLSMSVTYANALADLCEATGASMRALIPALRGDKRIGPAAYIRPGLGIAGGNLERDLVHLRELARTKNVDASLLDLILERSAARYAWLAQAVNQALERSGLKPGTRPRVALWGLAYKKNSRSTRNAVSLRLIADLKARAALVVYDPEVIETPSEVERAPSALEACRDADALVIVTDWDEFAALDPAAIRSALKSPVVVDAAGVLDPLRARAAGLTHIAIGEAL
ncbi:MAG TPA: nucleotide sugar dehydrogenase [Methylomirabilota bacterium]|nr:nucleotide sugar dehydrogenase [Methylomirabilota bacterium]